MPESILYVDDEEKALKYFKKIFTVDYRVFTATNADSAWKIIEEQKGAIAVVLSDQRMPGETGVELLKRTRQKYPKIIRMIITAYADLDNAIASVNEGAVYQYIVKPWDLRQLRLTLKQAVGFYLLQYERDMLMQTKLMMVQRLIISDRVQNISAFLLGHNHGHNFLQGFAAFISQLPSDIQDRTLNKEIHKSVWQDLGMAGQKNRIMLDILQMIKKDTGDIGKSQEQDIEVGDLFQSISDDVKRKTSNTVIVNNELKNCLLRGRTSLYHCFHILIQTLFTLYGDDSDLVITTTAISTRETIRELRIDLSLARVDWDRSQLFRCYSLLWQDEEIDFSIKLLVVYLILFHYGGIIAWKKDSPGFSIQLPANGNLDVSCSSHKECMEVLVQRFNYWDAVM